MEIYFISVSTSAVIGQFREPYSIVGRSLSTKCFVIYHNVKFKTFFYFKLRIKMCQRQ